MSNKRRVVITGLGVVTALGEDLKTFWDNLLAGKSGVSNVTHFDTTDYSVHIAGECTHFDPCKYIDKREVKRLDRFSMLAMAASAMAFEDSGLEKDKLDLDRCGCIYGSGIGGLGEIEKEYDKLLKKGPSRVSPFTVPRMMVNACSGNVSIQLGFRGPNTSVVTACASATNAIGDAMRQIQYGIADVVMTGGSEAAITPIGLSSFCSLKALSTRTGDPALASRPFSLDRDGFVLGEGAGSLLIEEYEHAKARGATIYAELLGFGMTADGNHITAPHADGRGGVKAMRLAINDAAINPDQMDYINAHGTSTKMNDASETAGMKTVYGDHAYKVSVSSTKSHLGHLLGASGGVELVACCLAMKSSVVPPTINLNTPDPDCDLDYTPNVPKERAVAYAMSNSFGFGGHNASVVIGKV